MLKTVRIILSKSIMTVKRKKTDNDTFKKITGLDVKNQDVIDSIMLVWGI